MRSGAGIPGATAKLGELTMSVVEMTLPVGGERDRPHNPHVQTLRVPNLSEIDFKQLRALLRGPLREVRFAAPRSA